MAKTLTDISIKHLKPGPAPREVPVGGARGLYLWVGATGAKSFVVRYRLNGKPKKLTLGRWLPPEDRREGKPATEPQVGDPLSLASARRLAADTMLQLSRGRDPGAAKREMKQAQRQAAADTFEAVATEYLRRTCGMKVDAEGDTTFDLSRKRSGATQHATLVRLVYPALGDRPMMEIRRKEVVRLLDKIEEDSGPVMADRTLALIRVIMNWHASRDEDFTSPIVRGMGRSKPSDSARDRVLKDDELGIIWKVAAETEGTFAALVRFLLLTAARRSEAAEMPWAEVDDAGDWTLPKERNKTKRELIRPLSDAAKAVLQGRPRIDGCAYVFTNDGRRPMTGYSKPKRLFDEALLRELRKEDPKAKPLPEWTLHDLRRTARSLLSRAKVDADHGERCLGHTVGGVRGVYDRYEYHAEKKQAFAALATLIERIVNPPAANVLLFAPIEESQA
jgi:integrase